jgi:hypothetical protein
MLVATAVAWQVALAPAAALAQSTPHDGRPRVDVAALLGLDAARAAQVEAILRSGREKMRALHDQYGRPADDAARSAMRAAMTSIRADTDAQLATVLTADELAQLKDAMPKPPGRGDGAMKRRTPT